MLDLRSPVGWLFLVIGTLLVGVGVTGIGVRAPLTTANVSLWTGIAMIGFGVGLLALAKRAKH